MSRAGGPKLSPSKRFTGFRENGINPYIWCVVGVILGGMTCLLTHTREKIIVIENLAVGVFGAYIGGDFVAAMLHHGVVNDKDFSVGSLGLAMAGAVVMLVVLRLMRRAVGPVHRTKAPRHRD